MPLAVGILELSGVRQFYPGDRRRRILTVIGAYRLSSRSVFHARQARSREVPAIMAMRNKTVTGRRAARAAAFDPGDLVMVGIRGKVLTRRRRDSAQEQDRAVVLFRGNLGSEAEVRALTAALRKAMGPALIGIDQEEARSFARPSCRTRQRR
jgi:hypothetical protein